MDNKGDITKESIRRDLLKNIDRMVDEIYKSINNPPFTVNLEDLPFIIEGNPYKELTFSDKLTGKNTCPLPSIVKGKEEKYLEVALDNISKKIRLTEQIFTNLYKFTYKNDMDIKNLPPAIINILEVYEIHESFQATNNPNMRSTNKWLLGVALFGNLRYQNRTNSPYITNKEAKNIVKGFIRNLRTIYYVINGKYVMLDLKNTGITLFDYKDHRINVEKVQ
jgi:hypothetical protein